MKTEKFSYNGQKIDFNPTRNGDLMINATQMAKAHGKDVYDFLKTEGTQKFILAFKGIAGIGSDTVVGVESQVPRAGKESDSDTVVSTELNRQGTGNEGGIFGIKSESDILFVSKKHGTWMHRILALRFASWLDARFELFLYATIDRIFFSEIRIQRDLVYQRLSAEAKQERDRLDLIAKYPEAAAYFENEKTMKEAGKGIKKSQSRMLGQFAIDFKDMKEQDK